MQSFILILVGIVDLLSMSIILESEDFLVSASPCQDADRVLKKIKQLDPTKIPESGLVTVSEKKCCGGEAKCVKATAASRANFKRSGS